MIRVSGLTKTYAGRRVVAGIELEVAKGELLVLVGPSGCGKTTTLKMINKLVVPDAGTVAIDGRDTRGTPLHELRRGIGYAFQAIGLFPHMTVGENVSVTPELLGWSVADVRARVDELLSLVELEPAEFRDRFPHELSGGQAQRVGLARALATRPPVLLMDEPFGALDPATRDTLQRRFDEIRRELDLTTVFVTHDMGEALLLGDRIAVMEAGELSQVDTPAAMLRAPVSPAIAALLDTPRRQGERIHALLAGDA